VLQRLITGRTERFTCEIESRRRSGDFLDWRENAAAPIGRDTRFSPTPRSFPKA